MAIEIGIQLLEHPFRIADYFLATENPVKIPVDFLGVAPQKPAHRASYPAPGLKLFS